MNSNCRRWLIGVGRTTALAMFACGVSHAEVLRSQVIDPHTGYAVRATIRYAEAKDGWVAPRMVSTDATGRFEIDVPQGAYLVEITAKGYRPMRMYELVDSGYRSSTRIMLGRLEPPEESLPEALETELREGFCLVSGYVVDAELRQPLADVDVRILKSGAAARTDARGYYAVLVQVPQDEEYPTEDYSFNLEGYEAQEFHGALLTSGDVEGVRVELRRGNGRVVRDITHKLLRELRGKAPREYPQSAEPERPRPRRKRPAEVERWLKQAR